MPGAPLVDVHRGLRERRGHVAHAPGVVEVDVGDGHAGQVVGGDAQVVEGREQVRDRGLAAGLDQDRGVAGDQVAGRDLVPAAEQRVDLQDARCDLGVHVTPSVRPALPGRG